jgi:hypothetical protein
MITYARKCRVVSFPNRLVAVVFKVFEQGVAWDDGRRRAGSGILSVSLIFSHQRGMHPDLAMSDLD